MPQMTPFYGEFLDGPNEIRIERQISTSTLFVCDAIVYSRKHEFMLETIRIVEKNAKFLL
jgi:hypothetical protein